MLPFENLSEDKSNAFFAEGIQDEILTRLAKIGALKVISRTSTQHYASSPDNLPEIARQLGVANILEGSVQKIGDAVHINVQLIRAATDDHLWAEIYNRKLDDIFGVQGEVAGAIALALNAKFSGAEKIAVAGKPTENPAAFEAYLRGRALDDAGYVYSVSRAQADAYANAVRTGSRASRWPGRSSRSPKAISTSTVSIPTASPPNPSSTRPTWPCSCNPSSPKRSSHRATTAIACCAISTVQRRLSKRRSSNRRTTR